MLRWRAATMWPSTVASTSTSGAVTCSMVRSGYLFDVRGADKCHGHVLHSSKSTASEETAELAAVGVAQHADVHGLQEAAGLVTQVLGQQYHAGAGSEGGQSSGDAFSERLQHVQTVHQLAHCGALAAGQDEPVHRPVKIIRLTDFEVLHTEAFQHLSVLEEGPL